MKKALSLALALVLCLGLAVPAFAAGGDFTIENGVLTQYKGPGGNVVIPNGVTTIGVGAFYQCTGLTSVTIPNSVTEIRNQAFEGCTGLTSVFIPNSVTTIGISVFNGCTSLTNVTIPNSVTKLDDWSLENCTSLTSVTIGNGVTKIGYFLLYNCPSLTSVTIGSGVTEIDMAAFRGCSALADVYYCGSKEQWKAITVKGDNFPLNYATIHYNSTMPEQPTTPVQPAGAVSTNDQLKVNGEVQNPTVYKINDNNYFKIRDLAAVLNGTEKQFDVGYDAALKSVTATTGKPYAKLNTDLAGPPAGGNQTADPSNDAIYIDGQKINAAVYKIGGNNYFKLRDLGKALDFYVGWTKEDGVFIDTSKPYSE